MLELNKERLRHLMTNAILELWKKETGSVSAVSIEGTICISSSGGRTVVVQVADRFTGALPEHGAYEKPQQQLYKRQSSHGSGPQVEARSNNAAAMAAYLDELSPASLISPPAESADRDLTSSQHAESYCDRSIHDSGFDDASSHRPDLSVSKIEVKDEAMSEDEDEELKDRSSFNDDRRGSTSDVTGGRAGPVCAGTGYYTLDGKSAKQSLSSDSRQKYSNRPATADHVINTAQQCSSTGTMDSSISDNFLSRDDHRLAPLMSTPKRCKRRRSSRDELTSSSSGADVLDLSRGRDTFDGQDLLLSPPHNYTAQVRDVIRQRLLAQKFCSSQLGLDEQNVNNSSSSSKSGLSPGVSSGSVGGSTGSEGKESGLSDSLPSTPLSASFSGSSGSAFLSPEVNPMLGFPFSPLQQQRSMLFAAGQLQEMLQRHMPAALLPIPPATVPQPPPHSPTAATFIERPASEPAGRAAPLQSSPSAVSERMSMSADGRRTPQLTNGEQKVYSCDFCHKTFLFKSKYQEHLPVHTNARPYQCRLCSRTYKYKYDLRVHLRTHLGIPTKSTLCPFCNDKFDTNKLLRHHIKDAHREHHKALTEEQIQMFDAI